MMFKPPAEWVELLDELNKKEKMHAVIAGGAVRDLYCGRQPKDIDIFVCVDEGSPSLIGAKLSNQNFYSWTMQGEGSPEYDAAATGTRFILNAWEIKRPRGLWPYIWPFGGYKTPLNLIYCAKWPSVHELLDGFDFGLCQAAYDGKNFITTEAFMLDYKNQHFTMTHGRNFKKSMQRYERISQRYQGWPLRLSGRAWLERVQEKAKETVNAKKEDCTI